MCYCLDCHCIDLVQSLHHRSKPLLPMQRNWHSFFKKDAIKLCWLGLALLARKQCHLIQQVWDEFRHTSNVALQLTFPPFVTAIKLNYCILSLPWHTKIQVYGFELKKTWLKTSDGYILPISNVLMFKFCILASQAQLSFSPRFVLYIH